LRGQQWGIAIHQPKVTKDNRGYSLSKWYQASKFKLYNIEDDFVCDTS
jgi:dTDP-4-dehydrorhamnose 3,5-epimerase-like enzyme